MGQIGYTEEQVRKAKVIVGWSCDSGMGVNTFLTSAAIETAKRGIRTALVELDIFHPAAAVTLGMSHPTRNLETWITNSTENKKLRDLSTYLVNSKIWLTDHEKGTNNFAKVISDLPEQLYTLAVSRFMDRFNARGLRLTTDMPAFIINALEKLDFEVIYLNVPSEMLMPVTGPSMKMADVLLAFLDGQVAHAYYTAQELKRLDRDLNPENIKLVLNRVPNALVKPVETLVSRKAAFVLPEDPSMLERSLDMLPTGGDVYENVIKQFCDSQGLTKKKGLFQDKKGELVVAATGKRQRNFLGIKRKA